MKTNEFEDNANNLVFVLSQQDIECWIVEEAQEVIDEAREIIKELLIENRILEEGVIYIKQKLWKQ